MKHLLIAALGIASLTSLNSCSVERDIVLNAADKVCSPGLKEKGELYIDGSRKMKSTGYKGSSSSWSGDIAYARSEHIGYMVSVRTLNEHFESWPKGYAPNEEPQIFTLTGMRADAAIGYFTGFGSHGKLETYWGMGSGNIKNVGTNPVSYNVSYFRAFGQFGAGFDNHIVSFMGGVKLTGQTDLDLQNVNRGLLNTIDFKSNNFNVLFLDPYAEAQVGYKFIKLSMQVGCNNVIPYDMNTSLKNRYFLSGFYFTTGIALRFAPRNSQRRVWGAKKYWEI